MPKPRREPEPVSPPGFTAWNAPQKDKAAYNYIANKVIPPEITTAKHVNQLNVPSPTKGSVGLEPTEPLTSAAFGKPMGKGRKKASRRTKRRSKKRTTRKQK
jgi:hypothetical protein